jgi:hypothetical protein
MGQWYVIEDNIDLLGQTIKKMAMECISTILETDLRVRILG